MLQKWPSVIPSGFLCILSRGLHASYTLLFIEVAVHMAWNLSQGLKLPVLRRHSGSPRNWTSFIEVVHGSWRCPGFLWPEKIAKHRSWETARWGTGSNNFCFINIVGGKSCLCLLCWTVPCELPEVSPWPFDSQEAQVALVITNYCMKCTM